jgi:hypothetical protein
MNGGEWLDTPSFNGGHAPYKNWQPQGCMTHQYRPAEIAQCVGNKKFILAGDSTVRQVYWAIARKLNTTLATDLETQASKHSDQNFTSNGFTLEYIWDPFLNSSRLERELWMYSEAKGERKTEESSAALMLVGAGAWFARWLDSSHSFPHFQLAIENVTANMEPRVPLSAGISESDVNGIGNQVFLTPVPQPIYDQLERIRRENILEGEMENMNTFLQTLGPVSNVLWSYFAMIDQQPDAVELAGLHVRRKVADAKADVLLNLRCNAVLDQVASYPFDRMCCSNYRAMNWEQKIILATVATLAAAMLYNLARGKESNPILVASFFFFSALAYCYLTDRTQIFAKAKKHFVQSEFNLLCGAVLLVGILTVRRSGKSSNNSVHKNQPFLSRDQTEEWKGWMQFAILIYHWTGASSILPIYQSIRLLVASYLFLTGFGHTCFFLRKGDFSLRRAANVLVRLNLLSCALPYMTGTDYLFYYFAPLVTFWFGVVWITMRVYASKNDSTPIVVGKVFVAAIAVSVILQTTAFDILFSAVKTAFSISWDVHEWKFRLSLDRYIVFLGMFVALLFERYNSAIASGTLMPSFNLLRIPAIIISLIVIPASYAIYATFSSKQESNDMHPYLSLLPILAFIILRNATTALRNYHSTFFAWLGTFSLETFVLQYHIWLAADTKGLLSLGLFKGDGTLLGDRWRDFVLLTPMFIWLSWKLAGSTGALTKALLHEAEDGEENEYGLLSEGLLAEKRAEISWLANIARRFKVVMWPNDLRAMLGFMFLGMWLLNLLW